MKSDHTLEMLEDEVSSLLQKLKYMEAGTGEYQAALEDLKTLKAIMEECKDKKFDKLLKIVSLVIEGGKVAAMVACVLICVFGDSKGLFVSKLGLGMIPKPRL